MVEFLLIDELESKAQNRTKLQNRCIGIELMY